MILLWYSISIHHKNRWNILMIGKWEVREWSSPQIFITLFAYIDHALSDSVKEIPHLYRKQDFFCSVCPIILSSSMWQFISNALHEHDADNEVATRPMMLSVSKSQESVVDNMENILYNLFVFIEGLAVEILCIKRYKKWKVTSYKC